jgi:hypothetical protein
LVTIPQIAPVAPSHGAPMSAQRAENAHAAELRPALGDQEQHRGVGREHRGTFCRFNASAARPASAPQWPVH